MIVEPESQSHEKVYTAGELAGDHWWVGKYMAKFPTGHTLWETATTTEGFAKVALRRHTVDTFRIIASYVSPTQRMVLVSINS